MVEEAARAANLAMISEFTFRNAQALKALVDEHGIKLRTFPKDVTQALYEASNAVIEEQVADDPASKRIHDSYRAFQQTVRPVTDTGEYAYLKTRDAVTQD